jgi:hypothetical protein
MHTLADFRSRYAETFDLDPRTWQNLQVELAPVLGLSIVGARVVIDTGPGFRISPPATPEDCGLMVIAAMLKGPRPTTRQRVLLRWHSQVAGGKCAITGATFLHEAITTLLRLPEVVAQLDHIELTREFASALLAWKDGQQTVFETRDVHDQARRSEIMSKGRLFTVAMLGGAVFHDIATWLAEEPALRPAALVAH